MGRSNFGGSILASHGPDTYKAIVHRFGTLRVVALPEIETHVLQYSDGNRGGFSSFSSLAYHANGHSCKDLANRILSVWEGRQKPEYALQQFDYILDCGGEGKKRSTIEWIVTRSIQD